MKEVGILGFGSQARETAGYLEEAGYKVIFFFVESKFKKQDEYNNIKIITDSDDMSIYKDSFVISAIGSPLVRKKLIAIWPYHNYLTFIHKTAWVASDARIGKDVVVPPLCIINTNSVIHDHVALNVGVTISHDSTLGEYATLSPGVHIAGKVTIGEGSFLGIGCNTIEELSIGNGTVIAAGATVIRNIDDSVMVAGVPAIQKKRLDGWYE